MHTLINDVEMIELNVHIEHFFSPSELLLLTLLPTGAGADPAQHLTGFSKPEKF